MFLGSSAKSDTMLLPIKNGLVIVRPMDNYVARAKLGAEIQPTTDLSIRSCTDGQVLRIAKFKDTMVNDVVVKIGDTILSYICVDSVTVKADQMLKRGDIIGFKTKANDKHPTLILYVSVRNRDILPGRFLVFQ